MRHNNKVKTLDRKKEVRELMFRNLVTQLLMHEKIKTTSAKAKAIKPIVEKIITKGKKNTLASHREILKYVFEKKVAEKVMKNIAPKYMEKPGGYTRIVKLGARKGDGAEMVMIELI